MNKHSVRQTRPSVAFFFIIGLLMAMFPLSGAGATTLLDHCPGANEGNAPALPAEYQSGTKTEANGGNQATINSFVPTAGSIICIKSGGQDGKATGIFTVDSSGKTLQEWLFSYGIVDGSGLQGRDVSYYMVYVPMPQPLTIDKTAAGSYDRKVDWSLNKWVKNASGNWVKSTSFVGEPGDSFPIEWKVEAIKTVDGPNHYRVAGAVTVTNPNAFPVPVVVFDELRKEGSTLAVTLDCGGATSVGANTSLVCSYTRTTTDDSWTHNYASATPDYPGLSMVPVLKLIPTPWTENLDGSDEAVLDDDRKALFTNNPALVFGEINGSTTLYPTETFDCPERGSEDYVNNVYTEKITNTATLTGENVSGSPASAEVTFICQEYEGLTPGFWKQTQHFDYWTNPYDPTMTLTGAGFVLPSGINNVTMRQALDWSSGSTLTAAKQKLIRQAVAALLNAAHEDIAYPLTEQQIKDQVNAALQSDSRDAVNTLAKQLDDYNNLGGVDLKSTP